MKSKWSAPYLQYNLVDLDLHYNKRKLYKRLDCWSRYMLNFDPLKKGLRLVISYSILNFQILLPDYLYF